MPVPDEEQADCQMHGIWLMDLSSEFMVCLELGLQPVKCLTSLIGSAHVFSVVIERSL